LPLDALPRDVWGLVFGFGYSEWAFTFDAPTSTGRIAAEDYYFIRPEFGFEVRGTRLRVQATASYLHLLSVDKLGTRNPEGWQGGLDARLTSSFRITDFLEVGASAAYARFFFKLHPIPAREAEDEPGHVADDYLRLSVFTRFAF
jgi:hypothetical protein